MKKTMKKLLPLFLAVVMSLAFAGAALAEDEATLADGSIKITPPSSATAGATNTYKIYKVFDATGNGDAISYTLCAGDTLSNAMSTAGFSVDNAGNVTGPASLDQNAIDAIADYVTEGDLVTTLTATGTTPVTATGLDAGYYYITTTTGSTVIINSTNPSAEVNDKNTAPSVDKKITGASSMDADGKNALAQVGTTVNYSAEITIGTGAKGYIFHDTMETGLTYNEDAAVTGVASGNYTVSKEGDDTFTITFSDAYIQTLAAGTTLTVTYSATVNEDAITTDPLNNTCYVSYGDENSNNKTPTSEADVYEAKFTVTKQDGDEKPLAGAGFVIKNNAGKYYKSEMIEGKPVVSWVDSIDDATEYTSNDKGEVTSFTGLANGTYTLVEKTVPSGYNKAADSTFTVDEHDYTAANLEQVATVTNNKGTELPSTGGIGTTIFYIAGSALVLVAGAALFARRVARKQS